ncbi:hypothetical protein [Nostoc sp. MG11]|uniref:hypothetical protein n=1 Tax=Nostoc sp. MG11 TaxID=2721166 RepID=UPI00186759FB|nr:hypothetical protein [Nostoc sp. MG11]
MRFEYRIAIPILLVVQGVCSSESGNIRRGIIMDSSCYYPGILGANLTSDYPRESALQVTKNRYKHLVSIPG